MDNLKSMVLDLIHTKSECKVPLVSGNVNLMDEEDDSSNKVLKIEINESEAQPSDQEILDSIDKVYYCDGDNFDPSRYILQKFDILEDVEELENWLRHLRQQHSVVSNQVLQMILEKQNPSNQELERVGELEQMLTEARDSVAIARRSLALAASHITSASLAILTNSRKRSRLKKLLQSLLYLSTLKETEKEGESRLRYGDMIGSIGLIVECLKAAKSFGHLSCVKELINKLQDTLVMAEEHLDQTTANVCYKFDKEIYAQIESGYCVLGKGQAALDQLLMHFTSAIHNSAYTTVQQFVNNKLYDLNTKPDYQVLCKMVSDESFIDCLTSLCKSLWSILLSYHQLINWDFNQIKLNNSTGIKLETNSNYNEEYRRLKLEGGRCRLWHDVQSRVSLLVLSTSLASYKFDDFLHFLAILHRLSEIGEELCGGELGRHGDELASSIKAQSQDYFLKYHQARLDDLTEIFKHESWTPCPIKSQFNLLQLQEWRGLRCVLDNCTSQLKTNNYNGNNDKTNNDNSSNKGELFFQLYPNPTERTPFDKDYLMTATSSNNDEQLHQRGDDNKLKKDYSSDESDDENNLKVGCSVALVGNTTLTVLRLVGKYIQMARYLESIIEDVVNCVCQLFEYYLFYVYHIFYKQMSMLVPSQNNSCLWSINPSIKLQAVLKRIKENLFNKDQSFSTSSSSSNNQLMTSMVGGNGGEGDLTNVEQVEDHDHHQLMIIDNLESKVVGVESLVFLSEQYHLLKPYFEQLLIKHNYNLHKLNQFYSQTVDVSIDLRGPVYWFYAVKVINVQSILNLMSKVDWEIKDVMSQHSSYVDHLINEVEEFSKSMDKITIVDKIPLPKPVVLSLWDSVCFLTANLFVQGFSSTRKCSNGGRALMQLDWAQYLNKLSSFCPIRPMPYTAFVENYIKAYYQPEQDLINWIKNHYTEYSGKQLVALVCSACQTDRKSRLRLTALLDELSLESNSQQSHHQATTSSSPHSVQR